MRFVIFASLAPTFLMACAAGLAQAQTPPPIKPGLWQVQTEREVDGQTAQMPDLSEHLKNLPPESRRQVEAMMKQRGVDVSAGGGAMRICMTNESLARDQWRGEQGNCKTDFRSRSGSAWRWHTSCQDPASETDGEASFPGPETYTVKTVTTMRAQGEPKTTRMMMTSKWLGADCEDVKPINPKP
jgi:Protein of unknown function (DUF3617)